MAEKQLIVVVEGTAAMGPFWQTIMSDYLEKIIRCFYGNESTGQKLSESNIELALVVFNSHGPYSAFLVQRTGWTKDIDVFLLWLSSIAFIGGGFSDVAIAEGLAEALMMFSVTPNGSQSQQNLDGQKHCILVAASNPHPLPTPVPRLPRLSVEQTENSEKQTETCLYDADAVARSMSQVFVSLSVVCPKQLPKLRAIYNAGKRSPRAADPSIDHIKNPQFIVLLSENFIEARAALSRPGITSLQSNQPLARLDAPNVPPISGQPPASIPIVNGSMMNRQAIPIGNIPTATVKVEPNTVSSMASGPAFSPLPSVSNGTSQVISAMQASTASPVSQEINTNGESMQEFKPPVNAISQTLRAGGPAPANVSILNSLSQARQAMNSASITSGSSIGLQSIGGAPMAMHMSNMISSGMASSALSGMTSVAGSGALMATAQVAQSSSLGATAHVTQNSSLGTTALVAQSSSLGSFSSATSNVPGNSNLGISSSLPSLQGTIGMGQPITAMGQGTLTSGSQMGQSGISMSQNVINGLGAPSISSAAGTMIPTPGMSQQVSSGLNNATNGSAMNMPLSQHASSSKYVNIWEGALSGQRQGQPVFICKLEGYRSVTASESLAADWPDAMQIVRLISQDHMNNKQYVGKADFLVFRTLNTHGFLAQLQEKKLCAVIQLPSQTLLLSVSDKASRLIGMLFPGDMVVFKPQISSQQQQSLQQQQLQHQQQQLQHQQQQQQLQHHQQQQQLQHQQQQQQLQHQQQQQQLQHQQQQQQQQLQQQQQQLQQQQLQQQNQLHQQPPPQQLGGSGINQTFVQGSGRAQMLSQGKVTSQGPTNLPGGGFLP